MMYPLFVYLIFLSLVSFCESQNTRIYFKSCNFAGFTCVAVNSRHLITYQCPPTVKNITLYINQFNSPATTESLTIQNCDTLHFSFGCSGEAKTIQKVRLLNITNLVFIKHHFNQLPPSVVLENITNIETIPSRTFSNVDPKNHQAGCIIPKIDVTSLQFKNVFINTIEPNSFRLWKDISNFTWSQVKIHRIQHSAINVKLKHDAFVNVENNVIQNCEHLSFQITGKAVTFSGNNISELASSTINGTIENFNFLNNTIGTVQGYAFSLLSENVKIMGNRFQYLKGAAFEKISPGLLQDSQRNFGQLMFYYQFMDNYINFVEASSLNPDVVAYENVASTITFSKNAIFCSCDNLAWLLSDIPHGYNAPLIENFYNTVLDETNNNICSYSCQLPVKRLKKAIKNGICDENVTLSHLCHGHGDDSENDYTVVKLPIVNVASLKNVSHCIYLVKILLFIFVYV